MNYFVIARLAVHCFQTGIIPFILQSLKIIPYDRSPTLLTIKELASCYTKVLCKNVFHISMQKEQTRPFTICYMAEDPFKRYMMHICMVYQSFMVFIAI